MPLAAPDMIFSNLFRPVPRLHVAHVRAPSVDNDYSRNAATNSLRKALLEQGALPVKRAAAALALSVLPAFQRRRQRPRSAMRGAGAPQASSPGGEAVVVGAGPSGLAVALMLAGRGWQVTVLERSVDPAAYNPGRGFMYLIDGRGQACLSALGSSLLDKLKASSVSMTDATIMRITPKGVTERVIPMRDGAYRSYWTPRHAFVRLLLDEARRTSNIKIITNAEIDNISCSDQCFSVHASSHGEQVAASGSLLIGADGINSAVRKSFESWDGHKGRFVPKKFRSPAAGLRYKVLTLPNNFELKTSDGSKQIPSEAFASVLGAKPSGPKRKLGLIPVASEHGMRTANLITKADDEVWKLETASDFASYARDQWPHFPLEELVSQDELARFAADRGGYFPSPQYSPAASWVTSDNHASDNTGDSGAGAVIIGDALHAFPPDLGQGVNSALQDVTALLAALEAEGDDSPQRVAKHYENERLPEATALVNMMRVGAPFQYSQSKWRSKVWTVCFLVRVSLNKLLPSIFDKPVVLHVQNPEMSYSEGWRRASRGAKRTCLLLGVLVLATGRLLVG
mmetsp:Transcript_32700/g.64401  ORF Transcript_32700/g.64401 Transcript_32700/m.64401 type:complete len:570 (-) Transcript_32700:174-1883(-)